MNKTVPLSRAAKYSIKKINANDVALDNFITTDNILQNKAGVTVANNLPPSENSMPSFEKDDILVGNIRPYLKKIWFANRKGGCSADVLVFTVNNGYNPKFVYYSLLRDDFFIHMMKGAKGTKMPRGDRGQIMEFLLPDFDLPTQQKIANVLSAMDAKIELNQRINNELELMAKTLFEYWFVQFDFPNEKGQPYKTSGGKMVWNDVLKREIPLGWKDKGLSEITEISTESINPMNFPDEEFRYYSIPSFDEIGTYKIEKGGVIMSNKFSVLVSDILVSKLNPWFNRVVYTTDESNLVCSTEFVVWRTSDFAIKNFLYMVARDSSFISYCMKSATGTSNSHKRVNPDVMMKYKVAYNKDQIMKFGNSINSIIRMVTKNKVEIKTLIELRDWLLPLLMNGQVKVRN